jgi:DNA-directed RNA polymerase specialized sigma24 family protein
MTDCPSWPEVVARIVADDPSGMEELYRRCFARGVHVYLGRRLGWQAALDFTHDAFVATVGAIHRGELRNPECLMGYVQSIVRRMVAGEIEERVRQREVRQIREPADRRDPERVLLAAEKDQAIDRKLGKLKGADLAIITRFYQLGDTAKEIWQDLGLTETQFRLRKSRALDRLRPRGHVRRVYRPRRLETERTV